MLFGRRCQKSSGDNRTPTSQIVGLVLTSSWLAVGFNEPTPVIQDLFVAVPVEANRVPFICCLVVHQWKPTVRSCCCCRRSLCAFLLFVSTSGSMAVVGSIGFNVTSLCCRLYRGTLLSFAFHWYDPVLLLATRRHLLSSLLALSVVEARHCRPLVGCRHPTPSRLSPGRPR
jgi:hypothetical protein